MNTKQCDIQCDIHILNTKYKINFVINIKSDIIGINIILKRYPEK